MMTFTLGYLGPSGTFTEEAALKYCRQESGDGVNLKEYSTIDRVIEGISSQEIDRGLVPLENSLEGSVRLTMDMLASCEGVYIYKEMVCAVSHCLLAPEGVRIGEIQELYSHPQVFSQCRSHIMENLPQAKQVPCYSTAAAVSLVAEKNGKNKAAIASNRASQLSGLNVLETGLEDNGDNRTRFVVLSQSDNPPTGADKTSVILSIKDGPGSLYNILGVFALRGINLTRIESRPARKNLGDYLFFIDFEGHREERKIQEALEELQEQIVFYKMLGSYPAAL